MGKYRAYRGSFGEAARLVAEQCYGRKGIWAHDAFDFINARYFGARLPHPHIVWGLTEYGGCVAWASSVADRSRQPVITLHPSLLSSDGPKPPWGIPRSWLGEALAFDTLLHECMHVHINTRLGGRDGPTSHNCERWVRQANRLAPMLGFDGIMFGRSKVVRVPIKGGIRGPRGKLPTRVVRVSTGNVPFAIGAGFPQSLRQFLGLAATHYPSNTLPDGMPRL